MNSGSFFRLNLEASKIVEGIAIFEYVDLPDLEAKNDILRCPIRLTITPDNVSFLVHFYNADEIPHHVEEVILNLPYRTNNTEKLSSIIKQIYNTSFPFSGYLFKLLQYRYDKVKQNDDYLTKKKKEQYRYIKRSQVNYDSYSSLYVWELLDDFKSGKGDYLLYDEKEKRFTKFLRKLLLDFMFDLMHSDVFECSKYYSQMKEGLMADFFFSAIVKKSDYYYYRRLIRTRFASVGDGYQTIIPLLHLDRQKANRIKQRIETINEYKKKCSQKAILFPSVYKRLCSVLGKKKSKLEKEYDSMFLCINELEKIDSDLTSTIDSLSQLYAERLDETEGKWIDMIMSPMADKHFSFSKKWYETRYNEFGISDSWFASPEKEMERVVFPLRSSGKNSPKEAIHYLNSFELSETIGTQNNDSAVGRNTKISKWFYRRFDFRDAFRIHFFQGWNGATIVSVFLFSLIVCLSPSFLECPYNLAQFLLIIAVGCLAPFAGSVYSTDTIKRRQKGFAGSKLDVFLVDNRRKREGFRALRMAFFFFFFSNFIYKYQSLEMREAVLKIIIMIVITILLMENPKKHFKIPNIHLFLPKLVASITAAWIMLVIGNDIIKEHVSIPLCIIVSIIVFAFILYENNRTLPGLPTIKSVGRAVELMTISYFFSLVIGVFALDVLSSSLFNDASIQGIEIIQYKWAFLAGNTYLTLTLFPDYLVQFSFLAMFIGVFVQMIFEEKNITEL